MKCILKTEPLLSETSLRIEVSNYNDRLPLLRDVTFRRQPLKRNTQAFALAAAILVGDYCGDVFEFPDVVVAVDYVQAIRMIIGNQVNVSPVNGQARVLATHEVDIFACQTVPDQMAAARREIGSGAVPLFCIDWSGDFVNPATRISTGNRLGMYFTNAALVTEPEFVSVALALMHGGDTAGAIFVPVGSKPLTEKHERLARALAVVAIRLVWLAS